jgi:hypothetical protein
MSNTLGVLSLTLEASQAAVVDHVDTPDGPAMALPENAASKLKREFDLAIS